MTTRGILIYAFNNELFDYVKMAACCAQYATHFLDTTNVALVTNNTHNIPKIFNTVIHITSDGISGGNRLFNNKTSTFYNAGRSQAYKLSPWDETLILDADLMLHSNILNYVWGSNTDFLISNNINPLDKIVLDNIQSSGGLHTLWATVIYFKKTERAKLIFDLVSEIKKNWLWYRHRYNINHDLFRNDYAFSIALHIMSYGISNTLFHLPYTINTASNLVASNISFDEVTLTNSYMNRTYRNTDIHYINKEGLLPYYA